MRVLLVIAVLFQFAQRPSLTPAETLLEPVILRAIDEQPSGGAPASLIDGTDKAAGEILITCRNCDVATQAMQKLHYLIREKGMPAPARTIRQVTIQRVSDDSVRQARAAIFVAQTDARPLQVLRGLWSSAGIGDEVVEIFARHGSDNVEVRPFEDVGQLSLHHWRIPTTTIVTSASVSNQHGAFVAAASAYYLATLPNSGSEALLSHLTVGAHARLAEDGRRAVALMGNQQRASGEVLILLGQAIEREQRRMRHFERFMPEPVDLMLRSRIAEMETRITSVWTSLGITSSPFVPASERLRGRAGDDRRVPSRNALLVDAHVMPPRVIAEMPNAHLITSEIFLLVDGKRSISDIRDVVSAEFGAVPLPAVVEYLQALANARILAIR